jgi:hypothetical protein
MVQLLLSFLLKNNWRLISWLQLMKQQFKDRNLPFDKMLCLLSARWKEGGYEGQKWQKMTFTFFHFSIVNNSALIARQFHRHLSRALFSQDKVSLYSSSSSVNEICNFSRANKK